MPEEFVTSNPQITQECWKYIFYHARNLQVRYLNLTKSPSRLMLSPPVPEMQRSTLRTCHLHMQQLNLIIDAKEKQPLLLLDFDGQNVHPCMSIQVDDCPVQSKRKDVPQDFWLRPHKYHFNSSYLNLLVCVIYQAFFHVQHFYQNQVLLNFSFCFKFFQPPNVIKCPTRKIAATKLLIAPTLQHGHFVLNVSRPRSALRR